MIKKFLYISVLCMLFLPGCAKKNLPDIPGISKDHPANRFYQFVSQNLVSDRVCRDYQGDPNIPMGEIVEGGKYTKADEELLPGVFRFKDNATGKIYLGVSFLQYSGFLQVPKLCSWEEKR